MECLGEHYTALKTCMKLVTHNFVGAVFFTLVEDFYKSFATRVGFFNLALSEIESCSVQTLEILSAVDSSTGKRKTFDK